MTQDEIEAEFHSLREQIFKLQQQREDQRKHWFRWGLAAFCIGVVLIIAGFIFALVTGSPPSVAIGIAGLLLFFLGGALGTPRLPPANLSVGSRLKWGWSGPRDGLL